MKRTQHKAELQGDVIYVYLGRQFPRIPISFEFLKVLKDDLTKKHNRKSKEIMRRTQSANSFMLALIEDALQ
jgi:hypothetical protein